MKADKCAQYVDDVGIGAHTGGDMIDNTIEVLQATQKAGLSSTCKNPDLGSPKYSSWENQKILKWNPAISAFCIISYFLLIFGKTQCMFHIILITGCLISVFDNLSGLN